MIKDLIKSLSKNNVELIIIGEVASFFYGIKTISTKLEVIYLSVEENINKIVSALSPFDPKLRDQPKSLICNFDKFLFQNTKPLLIETNIGCIDLLGEVSGVGNFKAVESESVEMEIFDVFVKVISLDDLIKAKHAAGRPKDLLVLPELEALREILSEEEE